MKSKIKAKFPLHVIFSLAACSSCMLWCRSPGVPIWRRCDQCLKPASTLPAPVKSATTLQKTGVALLATRLVASASTLSLRHTHLTRKEFIIYSLQVQPFQCTSHHRIQYPSHFWVGGKGGILSSMYVRSSQLSRGNENFC